MRRAPTISRQAAAESAAALAKRLLPVALLGPALDIYGRLNSLLYAGSNVSCPCCGGSFRRFKAYGASRRPGAMCPRCRSFERHRLLWLYLRRETRIFTSHMVVLHFAPEYWFRKAFKELTNLEYVTADIDSPLADIRTDITAIDSQDGRFDAVICVHVLEHVVDDRRALGEIMRVLKPGAWALIMVPVDRGRETTLEGVAGSPSERLALHGKSDHVRTYGRDVGERLEAAGFEVTREPYAERLGPEASREYGLSTATDIYLCVKPAGNGPAGERRAFR